MKNFVQRGETIDVVAPVGGLTSGELYVVGEISGVVTANAAEGETAILSVEGVFDLAKAAEAIAQGDRLYWDAGNSNVTGTATGNTHIGFAWADAAIGDATVPVKLTPVDDIGGM